MGWSESKKEFSIEADKEAVFSYRSWRNETLSIRVRCGRNGCPGESHGIEIKCFSPGMEELKGVCPVCCRALLVEVQFV